MQDGTGTIELFEILEGMDLFDLLYDTGRRECLKSMLYQMSDNEFEDFCRIYRNLSYRRDATAIMQ